MRELTSPVIDRVKNKVTYPAADGGQKICGIFSETAELERFSVRTVRAMAFILTTRMCVRTHTTQAHALTPAAKRRRTLPGGVGQASRAHIFAESAAQNPYIFRIAGLRVYRPAGTAGVNLNKVRR